jgi:hypothetical protein
MREKSLEIKASAQRGPDHQTQVESGVKKPSDENRLASEEPHESLNQTESEPSKWDQVDLLLPGLQVSPEEDIDLELDPLVEQPPPVAGPGSGDQEEILTAKSATSRPRRENSQIGGPIDASKLAEKSSAIADQKGQREDILWLEEVDRHILAENEFVAGGFGRHLPAWEELLRESKRASSKKALKWIRNGVRPSF